MAEQTPRETTAAEMDVVLAAAAGAARPWADRGAGGRAVSLRAVADALDRAVDSLVPLAMEETHLGSDRLVGEIGRTSFQLRLFAQVLEEGTYLEAIIDRPDPDWPPAPRPDLRRMLVPLGPVVVFAASNFPFAFSVAGGDTAAALAAGCPVVLKAHPGHLRLAAVTGALVDRALAATGAPAGTFAVIYGDGAGRRAVTSEHVKAGAFTGSLTGGRALFDLAASRPNPIPFYAEMGSLNPVFVTAAAMAERGAKILADFATSFTLSAGQFCTKPGLLFVPSDAVTDAGLTEALASHRNGAPLLNDHIHRGYVETLRTLQGHGAVRTVVTDDDGLAVAPTPTVLATTVPALLAARRELLVECFGPTALVVAYADEGELLEAAAAFSGEISAVVHGEESDTVVPRLLTLLSERAGRVIWNGWPTGVAVTGAMNHGGPYPATTSSLHTSVGPTAIDRFLRPVSYQSMPEYLLPPALRDDNPLGLPRRVNGQPEEA